MTQLKVRNTIKTAGNIYRDRFKEFYLIALINSFWIFVPVYGWAKYAAMMGLLARLAYGEVIGNPETIVEARRHIKPKTWLFFNAGLMADLVFLLKTLRMLMVLIVLPQVAIKYNIVNISPYLNAISLLLLYCSVSYYYPYWLTSHLFLYELPLATRQNISVVLSINIGWQLAEQKSTFKLVVIVLYSTLLVSLPYFFVRQIYNFASFSVITQSTANLLNLSGFSFYVFLLPYRFWSSFLSLFSFSFEVLYNGFIMPILSMLVLLLVMVLNINFIDSNTVLSLFSSTLYIVLFIAFRALLIPFWQSLKAVTYARLTSSPEDTELEQN